MNLSQDHPAGCWRERPGSRRWLAVLRPRRAPPLFGGGNNIVLTGYWRRVVLIGGDDMSTVRVTWYAGLLSVAMLAVPLPSEAQAILSLDAANSLERGGTSTVV